MKQRIEEIEKRLRNALQPFELIIIDDSSKHVGHAGAESGLGHFTVKIKAKVFTDKSLAQRHRMIYTALGDMMQTDIHALQIEANPVKPEDLIKLVTDTLSAYKAIDITVLDVTPLTDMMDAMVVCTATSSRHAASIADKLVRATKLAGVKPINRLEDQSESGWILVDLLDIIIHIMLKETREFYSLEKLWSVTESSRIKKIDQ